MFIQELPGYLGSRLTVLIVQFLSESCTARTVFSVLLDYLQHLHMVWLFVLKHLCIVLNFGTHLCDIRYAFFD